MFCSHCGAKVEPSHKYCWECGNVIESVSKKEPPLTDSTIHSHAEPPLRQKKTMPLWFKILTGLAVLALIGVTAAILFTEKLVDVVDYQLEALRNDNISKAYADYTSKDFQATTSLDQFRNFVEAYPVFHNNESAHFSQRSIDHHIIILKGYLTSKEHVNTPIEYRLIKEGSKWKILSMRLLKPESIQNSLEGNNSENLIEVTKGQLKDIQEQNISDAYQKFSSKEFKEATSEENFREFIKRYPVLGQHHVVSFHKPTIRNGVGTLSVIVQSDQIAAYVKYYLIYEDQTWKIWSMRVLSPSETEKEQQDETSTRSLSEIVEEPMNIGSITVGEKVNEQGLIKNPTTDLHSYLEDLYVDIDIENGRKGNMVYLSLQHVETGVKIPAQVAIEENGDTILMSAFSPPAKGWPKGKYTLNVTTSTGLNKTIDFDIT